MPFWSELNRLNSLEIGTEYVIAALLIVQLIVKISYAFNKQQAHILMKNIDRVSQVSKNGYFIFVTVLLFLGASHADAQQQIIDELREFAAQEVGPDCLGASYAAMINFAVNPDISTATYKIQVDSIDDPYLQEHRLPLRHVFKLEGKTWRPLIQINFAYQTQEAVFEILENESIDASWQIYGGSLAVGAEIPTGNHLNIISVVDFGIVRMKSIAHYNGMIADLLLRPALDGLLFNWEADA